MSSDTDSYIIYTSSCSSMVPVDDMVESGAQKIRFVLLSYALLCDFSDDFSWFGECHE